MKFDMGRAWSEALEMIRENGKLLTVVAAVFFFLPSLAIALLLPGMMAINPGDQPTPEQFLALFTGGVIFGLVVYMIISYVGTLSLLALMSDQKRPTVGEAIITGVKGLIPYLLAQIILALGMFLVFFLVAMVGTMAGSGIVTGLLVLITVPFAVWVYTKVSLTAAAVAIDEIGNPIAALARSWKLVSGNSLRVFLFYLVLGVTFLVVYLVLSIVLGLFVALLGAEIGLIIGAIVQGILGLAFTVLFLAVQAAIHRQLAGTSNGTVSQTFE